MSSNPASCSKIFISIETPLEQEEVLKNQRKTLKVLHGELTDKENCRKKSDKVSRLKLHDISNAAVVNERAKRKKVEAKASEFKPNLEYPDKCEKSDDDVKEKNLTDETPASSNYWERLAEKRRETLALALEENQRLHECAEGLENELDTSRQQLEEIQELVAILTEMVNENETDKEDESEKAVDGENEKEDNRSEVEAKKD
uniref:Geminin n=1 Tax=Glossina brevipalpis TaxID=37001 RepID=A0A1A9WV18_9MUSC